MARNTYPVFRKCAVWTVKNHHLYNLMKEHDISLGKLASICGVANRTVERWVYEGALPMSDKRETIAEHFATKASEIFPVKDKE